MRTIVKAMLRNPVVANMLMALFLVGGAIGLFSMIRESFPDFALDIVEVRIAYPGATPDEVEEGICRPLEDALEGMSDVKRITTVAAEGYATALIECSAGADVLLVKDDVKSKVDTITAFPEDAEQPIIKEVHFDEPVIFIAVWGDLPERQLKDLAEEIKDELVSIKGVSRVQLSGARDYQVSIEVSETRLREYGLKLADVSRAVAASSLNLPGGTLRTDAEDLKIRVLGQRYYGREFRDIEVVSRPDGTKVLLSDIADIRDTFDEEAESFSLFKGKRVVNVNVQKTENEDSIKIAEAVNAYVLKKSATLPAEVHLTPWMNQARLIQDRIDMLVSNGLKGLLLVFIILWLFLDLRLSFWVSLGIPVSLAGGIAIMAATGQSINMVSMFGMIMVLGIIVDDAIVVGESIYLRRSQGREAFDAAITGTSEVFLPVIMAVLTTITAFVPLYFVSGIMGKFIAVIPTPVVAALAISVFESLYILPVHLRHLPDLTKAAPEWMRYINLMGLLRRWVANGLSFVILRLYSPTLRLALNWRYASIAICILMLMATAGLFAGGFIKQDYFPTADSDFIRCEIELPTGVPISHTEAISRQVIEGWNKTAATYQPQIEGDHPLAVGVLSSVGGTLGFSGEPPKQGNQYTEIFIELLPGEIRNIRDKVLVDAWRANSGDLSSAISVTFAGLQGGPPGGGIEIDILGRDQERLVAAQDAVKAKLAEYSGVRDINSDYKAGKTELRIDLKPTARNLGLTLQDLALQLRHGFFGDEIMRVQRGQEEVKVFVRFTEDERHSIAQLEHLRIRTPDGGELPLAKVATLHREAGFATITRVGGMRKISITAEPDENVDDEKIVADLFATFLPEIERTYGVEVRLGTNAADRNDSTASMAIGAVIAILVIYMIMASIFRSYLQPALILFTIPIGVMGAFIGHMILGYAVSMMSFFGLVALTGVVVNDAIVFIVAVNERIADGMTVQQAIVEAGQRRFRAIILTSLTTFGGLFPMIMETSFQAKFLIPMAISIAFGVAAATIGTLLLIPCLLGILNDFRCLAHLMIHLRPAPSRESVEPAANIGHL